MYGYEMTCAGYITSPLCRSCQLFDKRYHHESVLHPTYYPMTEEDNCEYYIEKDIVTGDFHKWLNEIIH